MDNLLAEYIKKRISRNKNAMIAIIGSTGSGKSYSALKLAEYLDPSFNTNRIVFSVNDFINLVRSKLPKGSVIVFEEAGVAIHNRKWYSTVNLALNYVAQTFRKDNLIVIFTTPNLSFIDSQVRTLFHIILETAGIDSDKKFCKLKTKIISVDRIHGKSYEPFLRIKTDEGIVRCVYANVYLPSKKLIKEYELKKNEFTNTLYKRLNESIGDNKRVEVLTERQQEIYILSKYLKQSEIAKKLNIHPVTVHQTLKQVKKKLSPIS